MISLSSACFDQMTLKIDSCNKDAAEVIRRVLMHLNN